VENQSIDSGDGVFITENDLDCEDDLTLSQIEELEGRSVSLFHDCTGDGDATPDSSD
jgi:hypothetical protein